LGWDDYINLQVKSIIGNIIFLAALFLIIARFLTVWAGTPFPIDLVTSDSMHPSLMEGDIVSWTPTNIDDIEIGDVIVFRSYVSWPDEKIVVHRVSDIIDSRKGEKLLETKGDNNDWTDQKGPHIPEPYIREDHVVGKVLSIGQQPLKIPFVGYLGLWINQGLGSLSQPSTSKGSLSYVGIFAPLTVSVIFLVILLFILPEKARSIKEKIRLNVFGRKPLNIKRTLISFLVIYIIFLTVIHSFAYDSATASVGIGMKSSKEGIDFGTIKQGTESFTKDIPLINPSTMPVKGIVFGKGNVSEIISKKIFELEKGQTKMAKIRAIAKNDTQNGSYVGDIAIYSSPFWLIFPDDFINGILEWNSEASIYILDLLSAIILTSITIFMLISITFSGEKIADFVIDRSWVHPSRIFFKRQTVEKTKKMKIKIKKTISKGVIWLTKLDFSKIKYKENVLSSLKKPLIASAIVSPIIFILEDKILAMVISVLIAASISYMISCKLRYKIVITSIIAIILSIAHLMISSNLIILSQQHTFLELMALSLGAIGVYLLLFSISLLPLTIVAWLITRFIRNLKEQKDPLLSVEGSCDL